MALPGRLDRSVTAEFEVIGERDGLRAVDVRGQVPCAPIGVAGLDAHHAGNDVQPALGRGDQGHSSRDGFEQVCGACSTNDGSTTAYAPSSQSPRGDVCWTSTPAQKSGPSSCRPNSVSRSPSARRRVAQVVSAFARHGGAGKTRRVPSPGSVAAVGEPGGTCHGSRTAPSGKSSASSACGVHDQGLVFRTSVRLHSRKRGPVMATDMFAIGDGTGAADRSHPRCVVSRPRTS